MSAPWFPTQPAWRRRRARRAVAAELPLFLDELASAVRSGRSLLAGLALAAGTVDGPLGADLEIVLARLDRGASLSRALTEWRRRRDDVPGVAIAASALLLAAAAGGEVSQAIDRVADTVRSELDVRAEVGALSAQARASAVLIGVLPVGVGAVTAMADPRSLAFLIRTSEGAGCLIMGLGLDVAGWLWMRQIMRSAQW